ncbi:MAG: DUF1844 domain-containing protein [Capsulimonadaceae bacterium]|nr:DUF1844 domain-containing protein [Capsulimonadaceae bacterium]
MPEESAKDQSQEEGFTFVDKRRAAVEDDAAVVDPSETPEETGDGALPSEGTGGEPHTTYQLALYALGLLQMNAFQQLGLISDPSTGKAVRDLAQARVAIDCVAALAGVLDTPGAALDDRIKQDVRRVLTDLRLNFVTQSQMASGDGA